MPMHPVATGELTVGYDWRIVLLSLIVASLAAYTALDLTGPAAGASDARRRLAWTFAGTAALAIGVWAMHFIGMQAFHIAVPLAYDVPVVAASFVLAFAGAMVSLWWLVRGDASQRAVIRSSILLGLCLAGMHYTGMAALSIPATITYNVVWVVVSVVIAIVTSYAAFRLAVAFSSHDNLRRFVPKALTSLVLGLAIVSVHYTGMAGAHFYRSGTLKAGTFLYVGQEALAITVAAATVGILALFLLSAALNKNLREREREGARFRMLANSAPNLVWMLNPSALLEYCNPRFMAFAGDVDAGSELRELFHHDDVAATRAAWDASFKHQAEFNAQVRLKDAARGYRWHMISMAPVRDDAGRVTGWIGSATDIHEQKQAHMVSKFLEEVTRALDISMDLYPALHEVASLLCRYADWVEIQFDDASGTRQFTTCGDLSSALSGHIWRTPILADDREAGRITVVRSSSAGEFSDIERSLLDHVALRIGSAIAHANLFERERRVAQSFQQASLPLHLPQIPGLAFDAVYIPGGDEATVGGDWYDAVRLMDGRVVISIGDVAGSGLEAAVTMGNVRQIIRGIAQVHADPGLMLDAADRALRIENNDKFVTAFVAVLDPIALTLSYSSAGHPPAMLRHPDGTVQALSDGGLPLGLRQSVGSSTGKSMQLVKGCSLILYTDGLTESARTPVDGERRLFELLGSDTALDAQYPARWLRRRMLADANPHDDVAILVISIGDTASASTIRHWSVDVTDAHAAQAVRASFAQTLRERGLMEHDVAHAETVIGELLGNAVRYAPGMVDVILDSSASAPILHVLDRGPGFAHIAMLPADIFSESGRGLFIAASLTRDLRISKRAGGGSHARVVLSLSNQDLSMATAPSLRESLVRP